MSGKKRKDLFKNPVLVSFKAYYSDGQTLFPKQEDLHLKDFERLLKEFKKKLR